MSSELFEHASKLSEHESELCEHASKLSKHASELSKHAFTLFIWLLEPSTLEARVGQKDVRSSSETFSKSPPWVKCAHLGSGHRSWSHDVLDLVSMEELIHFVGD